MTKPVKIYFGAPLFSYYEQEMNKKVVETLRSEFKARKVDVDIYLPQENEALNDKSGYANSVMIAKGDTKELEESDILIAMLDGVTIDAGLASEIGVAYAHNKHIFGLFSDVRQGHYDNINKINALNEVAESQFAYINLYTVGLVKQRGDVVSNIDDLLQLVVDKVDDILDEKELNENEKIK